MTTKHKQGNNGPQMNIEVTDKKKYAMSSIRRDEEQVREEIVDMSVHKRGKGDEEPVVMEIAGEVDSGIDESQSKVY